MQHMEEKEEEKMGDIDSVPMPQGISIDANEHVNRNQPVSLISSRRDNKVQAIP